MKRIFGLFGLGLMAATALAQTQVVPESSIIPVGALDNLPHRDISNGIVSAKVYLPGESAFYRGTRFDRTGVVTHATFKGHDFGQPWFSSYSPYTRDFMWKNGQVTVSTVSAAVGPAEDFSPAGYDQARPCPEGAQQTKCGRFLKIGVGVMQRDARPYDFVHPYPIVNEGTRSESHTASSVRLIHRIADRESGFGYSYVKTVRLVPGKAQMTIEHVLTNTGKKDIVSDVYCHNFLTLSPGNENVAITAPFDIKIGRPFAAGAATVEGKTIRYLRTVKEGESVTAPITGFSDKVSDYDFTVRNTATGFGQRIRADQPLARINFWSIRTNVSWEPYIAINLKPGQTKRWTYTYDYFGPGGG
ncbi:MAG: hypothetical protein JO256_07580 [Alphaproteobacteria bacterium]|nr:hypothetical protein [Alphaproteobacteria bacterium]